LFLSSWNTVPTIADTIVKMKESLRGLSALLTSEHVVVRKRYNQDSVSQIKRTS